MPVSGSNLLKQLYCDIPVFVDFRFDMRPTEKVSPVALVRAGAMLHHFDDMGPFAMGAIGVRSKRTTYMLGASYGYLYSMPWSYGHSKTQPSWNNFTEVYFGISWSF